MTDILSDISTWSVLKWVVLVLIAGFIGQFGRMLAEAITARVRQRRANEQELPEKTKTPAAQESLPAGVPSTELPFQTADSVKILDKKALKALAKARKKEAKNK